MQCFRNVTERVCTRSSYQRLQWKFILVLSMLSEVVIGLRRISILTGKVNKIYYEKTHTFKDILVHEETSVEEIGNASESNVASINSYGEISI